jgi:tetratricopeptide (TPR) repeat protein
LDDDQRRRLHRATAELLESLKSRPDDMASHYNLGNFHLARGDLREAVSDFETASRLRPDLAPPYVNAALAYNALGENAHAETSLRHALRLEPTNAAVQLNFGMLMAEMGKMSEAEQTFRTVFKANPRSGQAAYNLGVLLATDRPAEGLDWCRRAAELERDNPRYAYTYAFYLHRAGRNADALAVLKAVLELRPAYGDAVALERELEQGKAGQPPGGAVGR